MSAPTPSAAKTLTRRRLLQGVGGVAAATMVGGIWNSNFVRIERRTLTLPKWDANGIRIAQVSDVHLNNEMLFERGKEAIRLAMGEKPDLILFNGDFVNEASPGHLKYIRSCFELLHDATCPCFGVLGNHDYSYGQVNLILDAVYESTPLRMLRNELVDVQGITLAGMDDGEWFMCQPSVIQQDKASKSLLVLLHEPDCVELIPEFASIQLSGHSHGGEICLPGGIPIHTPRGARRYKAGYYEDARVPLYITKGVGTLGPFRSYCPPDVTILTLQGA